MGKLGLGPFGVALTVSDTYLDEAAELERLGYSAIWLPGGQIDSLAARGRDRGHYGGRGRIGDHLPGCLSAGDGQRALRATGGNRPRAPGGGPGRPAEPPAAAGAERLPRPSRPGSATVARPAAAAGRTGSTQAGIRPRPLRRCHLAAGHTRIYRYGAADTRRAVRAGHRPDDGGHTDAARARRTARRPLRFLSGLPGYAASFARMGFTPDDIAEVTDRLVDELVIWGDADTISARITSTGTPARTTSCCISSAKATSPARSKSHAPSPAACPGSRVLPLVTSAICVSRGERGPAANQDLACSWWHGTANLGQRPPFFAGKVLETCGAGRRDHLPPPGRADTEQACFCYRLAQVVMVSGCRLHEAQRECTAAEHQWEADLLLHPGMNFQQACQPRPDLVSARCATAGSPRRTTPSSASKSRRIRACSAKISSPISLRPAGGVVAPALASVVGMRGGVSESMDRPPWLL